MHLSLEHSIYLLERLENFDNKEPVLIEGNEDITIEHIFPQNPDSQWKSNLSTDEFNFIKENYLNTIGNLTLSGNNGKLSNKSFPEKRDLPSAGYKDSRLWLNKYLSILDKWDKTEIERRFDLISERFLKIWGIPDISINEGSDSDEVNIFDAELPTNYRKLEYAIFFDQRMEVSDVTKLYVEVFKRLFELQPQTFFTTELGEKIGLTKKTDTESKQSLVPLNDTYFMDKNVGSNIVKFDRIKFALRLFDFEDELIIKYAEK